MLDELAIYNLSVKYPNTIDLVREVERIAKAEAIDEFATKLSSLVSNKCDFIITEEYTYYAMEQEDIDKLIYETAKELKEQNK